MLNITSELRGRTRLQTQLNHLKLPPSKRFTLNRRLIKKVAKHSKRRITQQRELDGSPFEPRKKRGRKKMLRGLRRRMRVRANPRNARATWMGGKVAYKHQHGYQYSMTARKLAERERRRNPSEERSRAGGASRSQAKALLAEGYVIPRTWQRSSRSRRRPTVKWITENLTMDQAGWLIRLLRNEPPKQSWKMELPARPFLGVNTTELRELRHQVAREMTADL